MALQPCCRMLIIQSVMWVIVCAGRRSWVIPCTPGTCSWRQAWPWNKNRLQWTRSAQPPPACRFLGAPVWASTTSTRTSPRTPSRARPSPTRPPSCRRSPIATPCGSTRRTSSKWWTRTTWSKGRPSPSWTPTRPSGRGWTSTTCSSPDRTPAWWTRANAGPRRALSQRSPLRCPWRWAAATGAWRPAAAARPSRPAPSPPAGWATSSRTPFWPRPACRPARWTPSRTARAWGAQGVPTRRPCLPPVSIVPILLYYRSPSAPPWRRPRFPGAPSSRSRVRCTTCCCGKIRSSCRPGRGGSWGSRSPAPAARPTCWGRLRTRREVAVASARGRRRPSRDCRRRRPRTPDSTMSGRGGSLARTCCQRGPSPRRAPRHRCPQVRERSRSHDFRFLGKQEMWLENLFAGGVVSPESYDLSEFESDDSDHYEDVSSDGGKHFFITRIVNLGQSSSRQACMGCSHWRGAARLTCSRTSPWEFPQIKGKGIRSAYSDCTENLYPDRRVWIKTVEKKTRSLIYSFFIF